jgi:hypothetical protein
VRECFIRHGITSWGSERIYRDGEHERIGTSQLKGWGGVVVVFFVRQFMICSLGTSKPRMTATCVSLSIYTPDWVLLCYPGDNFALYVLFCYCFNPIPPTPQNHREHCPTDAKSSNHKPVLEIVLPGCRIELPLNIILLFGTQTCPCRNIRGIRGCVEAVG